MWSIAVIGVAIITFLIFFSVSFGIPVVFTKALNRYVRERFARCIVCVVIVVAFSWTAKIHAADVPTPPAVSQTVPQQLQYLWILFSFFEPKLIFVWFLVAGSTYLLLGVIKDVLQSGRDPKSRS